MFLKNKSDIQKSKSGKNIIIDVCANLAIMIMLLSLSFVGFSQVDSYSYTFSGSQELSPIYKGNLERNEVSLMINVYWGEEYLPDMLKTLKAYDAKCTFFIGGCWADDNNSLLKDILNDGHELANHGFFHKDHKQLSLQQNKEEIATTNDLIKAITGTTPTLFAPPSGSYGNNTLSVCKSLGMQVIMWSRDTIDWRDKDADLIYKRATENIGAGDMILMHPTYNTAQALEKILIYYKQQGLKAVTVSQIIS